MSKLRFLFLENNSVDAKLIIDELCTFGFLFEHLLAYNKQDFLAGLKNFNPHIVFANYMLPGYNGKEVIKEIINKHQGIPIIIVSASTDEETAVECMKLGASDYILKNNLTRLGIATKSALEIVKLREENRKVQEEIKAREAQLLQSQKMEAIGLMASGIAHNFNNILQVVVAYIDFAKEGLKETDQRYKDIEQINQHIKRATRLTKSLLAVGKEQLMTKNDIDINDIMKPIVDITNRTTQNNIKVKFITQENLPTIIADGSQIDQVIMNIFLNAKDAMPTGGLIDASTQHVFLDKVFCSNNAWAKVGEYILTRITDSGAGMDADTKSRIFEPFFTTKDVDKGTGLGLSTAFGIISQHNGLLNVISKKNQGTTFEIYLPLT